MHRTVILIFLLILTISVCNGQKSHSSTAKDAKPFSTKSTISTISFGDFNILNDRRTVFSVRYRSEAFLFTELDGKFTVTKLRQTGAIDRMYFANALHGWISQNRKFLSTRNGGVDWCRVADVEPGPNGQSFFLEDLIGWVVDKDGSLIRVNGKYTEIVREATSLGSTIKKIQFVSDRRGWLVEHDPKDGTSLFATLDGGLNWSKQIDHDKGPVDDFIFLDEDSGWVIASATLFSTLDGGASLLLNGPLSNQIFNRVFFLDHNYGWVFGKKICRTLDGGGKWSCSNLQTDGFAEKFAFVDKNKGWIVTDNNVYSSTDGGITWRQITGDFIRLIQIESAL